MSKKIGQIEFNNFILRGEYGLMALEQLEYISKLIATEQAKKSAQGFNDPAVIKEILDGDEDYDAFAVMIREMSDSKAKLQGITDRNQKIKLQAEITAVEGKFNNFLMKKAFSNPNFIKKATAFDPSKDSDDFEVKKRINRHKIEAIKYVLQALKRDASEIDDLSPMEQDELLFEVMSETENSTVDVDAFFHLIQISLDRKNRNLDMSLLELSESGQTLSGGGSPVSSNTLATEEPTSSGLIE